jgi:hypothetical protein
LITRTILGENPAALPSRNNPGTQWTGGWVDVSETIQTSWAPGFRHVRRITVAVLYGLSSVCVFILCLIGSGCHISFFVFILYMHSVIRSNMTSQGW